MANAGEVNGQITQFKTDFGEYLATIVGHDNTTITNMQANGQQLAELLHQAGAVTATATEDIGKQGNAMRQYGVEGTEGCAIMEQFEAIFVGSGQEEPTNPHAAAAYDHLIELLINRQGFVDEEILLARKEFQDLQARVMQLAQDVDESTMRFVAALERARDGDAAEGVAVLQELDNYGTI